MKIGRCITRSRGMVWVGATIAVALLLGAPLPASAQISLGGCATFPIKIQSPGSYILQHNLRSKSGFDCINVKAAHVNINLNGFAILAGKVGINATGQADVSVRNGTVTGMSGAGIIVGEGGIVEDVRSDGNGADGIECIGNDCTISGNSANLNKTNGIEVNGSAARISGNTANANSVNGIMTAAADSGENNIITGNTANGNTAGDGIQCGYLSLVNGNTANENGLNGISCGTSSTVNGNIACLNKESGISVGDNVRIAGNVVNNNAGDGITAGTALAQSNEADANGGYGLDFGSSGSGYTQNVLTANHSSVNNGVSMSPNLCNGSPC